MTRVEIIGDCTLYLGDCLEILPTLGKVDAVVTDPPYGNKHGGDSTRFSGGNTPRSKGGSKHGPIAGNEVSFDPAPFMIGDVQIFFGANYFPHPPGSLLVWAKRRPPAYGTFLSDGEVAWLSKGRGIYIMEKVFSGSSLALEYCTNPYAPSAHPFQKPIAVMEWCLGFASKAEITLDPFMGSGTTGVACVNLGRKFIGIEIDPKYFEITCRRIEAVYKQPGLFSKPKKERA